MCATDNVCHSFFINDTATSEIYTLSLHDALPISASALAIILAIFAGIAAPAWFDRAKEGLSNPALPPDLLGLLTLVMVPLQVILIAVSMVAFNQEWHVEEERPIGDELPPVVPPKGPTPTKGRGAGRRTTAKRTSGAGTRSTTATRRTKQA